MRRLASLLMVTVLVSTTSCSGPTGPDQAEIESYLEERIAQSLDINELRYEMFMETGGGAGRVSCAGTLVLNTDLYGSNNTLFQADLEKAVGGKHVLESMPDFITDKPSVGPDTSAYQIINQTGAKVPFKANLVFLRIVDGWEFTGRPEYNMRGVARSEFGRNAMIVGDAKYQASIERVVERKQAYELAKKRLMADMETFFSPDKEITVYRGKFQDGRFSEEGVREQPLTIKTDVGIKWKKSRGGTENFEASGQATWNTDGRWGNSFFHAGETVPVRLHGEIAHAHNAWRQNMTISEVAKWIAEFTMSVPDKKEPGKFYNTGGDTLQWNGSHFHQYSHLIAKHKQ